MRSDGCSCHLGEGLEDAGITAREACGNTVKCYGISYGRCSKGESLTCRLMLMKHSGFS